VPVPAQRAQPSWPPIGWMNKQLASAAGFAETERTKKGERKIV